MAVVEDGLKRSTVVKHTLKDDRTTGVIHKEIGSDGNVVKDCSKTPLLTILHTLEEIGLTLFVPVERSGHVVHPGLLLLLEFFFLLLTLFFFLGAFLFCFGTGSFGLFLFSLVALLHQVVNVFVVGLEVFTGLRDGLGSGGLLEFVQLLLHICELVSLFLELCFILFTLLCELTLESVFGTFLGREIGRLLVFGLGVGRRGVVRLFGRQVAVGLFLCRRGVRRLFLGGLCGLFGSGLVSHHFFNEFLVVFSHN